MFLFECLCENGCFLVQVATNSRFFCKPARNEGCKPAWVWAKIINSSRRGRVHDGVVIAHLLFNSACFGAFSLLALSNWASLEGLSRRLWWRIHSNEPLERSNGIGLRKLSRSNSRTFAWKFNSRLVSSSSFCCSIKHCRSNFSFSTATFSLISYSCLLLLRMRVASQAFSRNFGGRSFGLVSIVISEMPEIPFSAKT